MFSVSICIGLPSSNRLSCEAVPLESAVNLGVGNYKEPLAEVLEGVGKLLENIIEVSLSLLTALAWSALGCLSR